MNKTVRRALQIAAIAAVVLLIFLPAILGTPVVETGWALVPPLAAIILALVTKEVYLSLFVGVLAGALFNAGFHPVATLDTMVSDGFIGSIADSWNAGIFLFLVMLGILVALINRSGAAAAFGRWAEKNIHSRVGALLATFLLGVLIFVDDYFNCLTVGSVMRPVTDGHKVSRAKLAYIIDATAAPICMIAPISSWAAAVSSVATDLGTYSGIELFVRAIPYNFYSLLTLVFVVGMVVMRFDYGPMSLHEMNVLLDKKDESRLADSAEDVPPGAKGKVVDMVLPIVTLIVFCVVGMIYVGGFFQGADFVTAFGDTDASVGLPWGTLIALVLTIIFLTARRVISFKDAMDCIPKGFTAMVPAILVLTFALSLKKLTSMLGADVFVGQMMKNSAEGLANFLPAIIFVVACFLAFATGTSWGTFGILLPIVTAIFPGSSELLIISISACLAGAVCGDHCSPISDTTIMASAGAQCNHVVHVSTQLPYALTVAAVSFCCFLLAGFVQNVWICLATGVLVMVGVLFALRAFFGKTEAKE